MAEAGKTWAGATWDASRSPLGARAYFAYADLVRAGTRGHDAFVDAAAACRDLDPADLVQFARAHQLHPWMGFVGDGPRAGEILPEDLLATLREARDQNVARAARLSERSREIRELFQASSIDVLFLKGLTHGARLYDHPAQRFQADIDLLVHRQDVRRAVEAISKLGYDTSVDASTGQPLSERVAEMLGEAGDSKLRNSCTIGRAKLEKVDVHWCIRTYYERAVRAEGLWEGVRETQVDGFPLPTLSHEKLLVVLLLNVATDLRKARCRAKLFLDLYLACRAEEPEGSWRGFLQRRRAEGSERLAVNVLALLLALWRCGDELPALRDAVRARAHLIETSSPEEALAIVTRPRDDPENRRWHARIHSETRKDRLAQLAREPGHTAARLLRPRRGASLLRDA